MPGRACFFDEPPTPLCHAEWLWRAAQTRTSETRRMRLGRVFRLLHDSVYRSMRPKCGSITFQTMGGKWLSAIRSRDTRPARVLVTETTQETRRRGMRRIAKGDANEALKPLITLGCPQGGQDGCICSKGKGTRYAWAKLRRVMGCDHGRMIRRKVCVRVYLARPGRVAVADDGLEACIFEFDDTSPKLVRRRKGHRGAPCHPPR